MARPPSYLEVIENSSKFKTCNGGNATLCDTPDDLSRNAHQGGSVPMPTKHVVASSNGILNGGSHLMQEIGRTSGQYYVVEKQRYSNVSINQGLQEQRVQDSGILQDSGDYMSVKKCSHETNVEHNPDNIFSEESVTPTGSVEPVQIATNYENTAIPNITSDHSAAVSDELDSITSSWNNGTAPNRNDYVEMNTLSPNDIPVKDRISGEYYIVEKQHDYCNMHGNVNTTVLADTTKTNTLDDAQQSEKNAL